MLETGFMVDRGIDLEGDLPMGVELNIPAFMNGKDELDLGEETRTRRIVSTRIHMERTIARVKSCRILNSDNY